MLLESLQVAIGAREPEGPWPACGTDQTSAWAYLRRKKNREIPGIFTGNAEIYDIYIHLYTSYIGQMWKIQGGTIDLDLLMIYDIWDICGLVFKGEC